MKYLVLGSHGQIGLSLCEYLRAQGHTVTGLDIALDPLHDLRQTDNHVFHDALDRSDFVFHLAWDVGGSGYLQKYQDTYDFISNNLKIAAVTFDAIRHAHKPFIFASSQMASMSYSSYGLTKNLAERMVRALDGITVKFWNVYGIELDPEKTHVVTDFINKARKTGCIDMRTDGRESRQMLHVDDCSRALYQLSVKHDQLPRDHEYHITSFEWHTMLDVAEIIAQHYPGCRIRPADAADDIQKNAKNEPNPHILQYWRPEISLAQGIAQVIDHMETHL